MGLISLITSSDAQSFNLDEVQLTCFFLLMLLVSWLRISCQNEGHEGFPQCFKSFMLLALTFRLLIHFNFFFQGIF